MSDELEELQGEDETLEALEGLRKKLLDLTAHNPLLNFRHGRSNRYLRIVDELPSQVSDTLLDGKSMKFGPVPKPSEQELEFWKTETDSTQDPKPDEWAEREGIDTSFDVPDVSRQGIGRRHGDKLLQTLHFPVQLEARLGNIAKLARTSIEETGVNMLHLAVGYLEWYEDESSTQPRQAPLITIPVSLDKGKLDPKTRTYEYQLSYSGEDCQDNVSLAARLEADFGYELPRLPEEFDVEDYLAKVARTLPKKDPRWRVRRFVTLCFLNFAKLLMYRDLDPERWPADRQIGEHPLVRAVVSGSQALEEQGSEGPSLAFEEEIDIDGIEEIYEDYPLIDNADSSQHSALIDAVRGKNLVIEGPPGTGKSQTITNLIAAAMHAGKSVLFVSEKLAALEVVKQRLDHLGLGDFCLELHSHATKKSGVLESLKRRLETPVRKLPRWYDQEIAHHLELRDKLGRHTQIINSKWKETGFTIHEILVAAARLREELPEELHEVVKSGVKTNRWTKHFLDGVVEEAKAFQNLVTNLVEELRGMSIADAHPWRGFGNLELLPAQHHDLQSRLEEWNGSLSEVVEVWGQLSDGLCVEQPEDRIELIWATPAEIRGLTNASENLAWQALPWAIEDGHKRLASVLQSWRQITKILEGDGAPIDVPTLLELDIPECAAALSKVRGLGFRGDEGLAVILASLPQLEQARDNTAELANYFDDYAKHVEGAVPSELSPEKITLDGLGKICSALAQIRERPPEEHDHRFREWVKKEAIDALRETAARLEDLQDARKEFGAVFDFERIPPAEELPELIDVLSDTRRLKRLLSSKRRKAKARVVDCLVGGKKSFDPFRVAEQLRELETHLSEVAGFVSNVETEGLSKPPLWNGLTTDAALLTHRIDWHEWLLEAHSNAAGGLFPTAELDEFGAWLVECAPGDLLKLLALDKVGFENKVFQILEGVEELNATSQGQGKIISDKCPLASTEQVEGRLAVAHAALEGAQRLQATPGLKGDWILTRIHGRLAALADSKAKLALWMKEIEGLNQEAFSNGLPEAPVESPRIAEVIKVTRDWGKAVARLPLESVVRVSLSEAPTASKLDELRKWVARLTLAVKAADKVRSGFSELASPANDWYRGCQTLRELISRNSEALAHPEMLTGYLSLLASRATLKKWGFAKLSTFIQSNEFDADLIGRACHHALMDGLSRTILQETPSVRSFAGTRQNQVQSDFQNLDRKLMELTREKVASEVIQRPVPRGVRGVRVREHTELELIKHESGKQRRHVPIRQLLKRAGEAAKAMKPCFMMGPRSVAQYLDPGGITFDMLVIDEASQMKPADAIGAAARVSQVVVVGDPKQLPPTSFFDRLNRSEDDEEEFSVGTSESILDAVSPIFPARRLRWHYRSRHESLVAFSNQSFYDNHLLLFPSPGGGKKTLGIRHRRVPDGRFAGQVNEAEATAIAARVRELLCHDPQISLGVATMNAKQRDCVEGFIEELAKEDPAFDEALAHNAREYEKLFIKNLESVQGDERAIILISCTYGPESIGGRVYQRFGPINSEVGWRRLNVLFTRARERMEIFTSLSSGDVLADVNSNRGVRAFKEFLHYAETGVLHSGEATGRGPDSDFEIAVAKKLEAHGFECDYQVGLAGFFIDLGVKHPGRTDEYVMGIECDGATYHSGKSVRDRDRLRQEILEGLGWNIKRIWSADWFHNPKGALVPILSELEQLVSSTEPAPEDSDGKES